MAFPTTPILDSFTRANENPLGGGWATGKVRSGDSGSLKLVSNKAQGISASNNNTGYWNTSFALDQEVFATCTTNSDLRLFARINNPGLAGVSYYMAQFLVSGNQINVYGEDGATETYPIFGYTPVHGTLASGCQVGLRVTGNSITNPTIEVWVNYGSGWVFETSGVDTSSTTNLKTAGKIGAFLYDSDPSRTFDDFGGGTVGSSPPAQVLDGFPQVKVEIGFASNPGTAQASITWTDVSTYCRGFSTSRGRRHELANFEAGTASITLNNRDRRFEPTYTGSAYYPNVVPLRPVRISAVYNAITYRLFTGFIEEWPPTYNGPSDSDVTVSCVDGFEPLSQLSLTTSYSLEASSTRITNVLNDAGWPAGDRAIGAGDSNVQAVSLSETPALQHIQDVASTELGRFFISGAGVATFQHRTARFSSPYITSQGTFGDAAGELNYIDLGVAFTKDEIRNDALITRNGGVTQEVSDSTSITSYLKRAYTASPLLTTDTEALGMAQWIVATYKDPKLRITGVTIRPRMQPATLWPQGLGREIGDRITVNRRPPGGAGTVTGDHFIEGIAHTASHGSNGWTWITEFFTTPASQVTAWVLGTSQLGSTTQLVY